jgi:hypothetical protein
MGEPLIDRGIAQRAMDDPSKSIPRGKASYRRELIVFAVLIICISAAFLIVTANAWGIHPGEDSVDTWVVGP